jgi:hypothetical protein
MMKSNELEPKSDYTIQTFNDVKLSVVVAFERTGTDVKNIENIVTDLMLEFSHVNTNDILQAIRNGGLGMYGKTYKLTTQEICIWIRTYLKDNSPVKAFHPTIYD